MKNEVEKNVQYHKEVDTHDEEDKKSKLAVQEREVEKLV